MSSAPLIADDDCDLEKLVAELEVFSDDGSSVEDARQLCAAAAKKLRNAMNRQATLEMQLRLRDRALSTLGAHMTAFNTQLGLIEQRKMQTEAIGRWGLLGTWCCCLVSQENLEEEGMDPGVCGEQCPHALRAQEDERLEAVEEQEAILYARMQHIVEMQEEMLGDAAYRRARHRALVRASKGVLQGTIARQCARSDSRQPSAVSLESPRGGSSGQQLRMELLERGLQLGDLTQSLQEVPSSPAFQNGIGCNSVDPGASMEDAFSSAVLVRGDDDLDQEVKYAMAMESNILIELETTIGVATTLRGM